MLLSLLLLLAAADPVPVPDPVAAPVAVPIAAPAADPVPVPDHSAFAAPAPRLPSGRNIELALVSQAIFDPGIHVFARSSYVNSIEVRYHQELADIGVRVAPEIFYGVGRSQADLGMGLGELYLQRLGAGARASVPLPGWRALRGIARAGALGMHATALVHDPYRTHREEASAFGGYGGLGLELDAGPITRASNRLVISMEMGHTASTGFALGRMGRLDVNALYLSWGARLRF